MEAASVAIFYGITMQYKTNTYKNKNILTIKNPYDNSFHLLSS